MTRPCSPEDLVNNPQNLMVAVERNLTSNPCGLPPVPGLPAIERFPHPSKADRFILCDSKSQGYVVLCPQGEIYNASSMECRYDASMSLIPTVPTSTQTPLYLGNISMTSSSTTHTPTGGSSTKG